MNKYKEYSKATPELFNMCSRKIWYWTPKQLIESAKKKNHGFYKCKFGNHFHTTTKRLFDFDYQQKASRLERKSRS